LLTATIPQAGESDYTTTDFCYVTPFQAIIPRIPLLIKRQNRLSAHTQGTEVMLNMLMVAPRLTFPLSTHTTLLHLRQMWGIARGAFEIIKEFQGAHILSDS